MSMPSSYVLAHVKYRCVECCFSAALAMSFAARLGEVVTNAAFFATGTNPTCTIIFASVSGVKVDVVKRVNIRIAFPVHDAVYAGRVRHLYDHDTPIAKLGR